MKTHTLINIAAGLLALGAATLRAEPTSIWLSLNTPSIDLTDAVSTNSHAELRFPEASEFTYYRLSQKVFTKLSDSWTLGSHPVFENSKSGDNWSHTFRLDMELNPAAIALGNTGAKLSMRNRWELRWKEGNGSEIFHRIRHQSKVSWKLSNRYFSSFSIGDELFFEEDKGKLTLNRFYPIMLSANHGDSVKGSYYLMYQSKRSGVSSNWEGEYILGASLSF